MTPCGPIRQADVDDVRRLRAGVVLVGLDGFELVLRAAAGVEPVDRDPVLGGEAVDELRRSCTSRAAARWCSGRLRPWPRRSGRPCWPRRPKPLPTRRPMPGPRQPAADPAAVGAVELPLDEHAANTKLATTRRPAIRVTFRWVDNIRPPVACVGFPIRRLSGASFPGTSDRLIHRQCGGRRHVLRGLRVHWTARFGRASRGWTRIVNGVSPDEYVRAPDAGHILPDDQASGASRPLFGWRVVHDRWPRRPRRHANAPGPAGRGAAGRGPRRREGPARPADGRDGDPGARTRLARADASRGGRPRLRDARQGPRRLLRAARQRGLHRGQAAQRAVRRQAGVLRRRRRATGRSTSWSTASRCATASSSRTDSARRARRSPSPSCCCRSSRS